MTIQQCYDWLNQLDKAEVVKAGSEFYFKRVGEPKNTVASITGVMTECGDVWENCFGGDSLNVFQMAELIVSCFA